MFDPTNGRIIAGFNPRPRMGGDIVRACDINAFSVSIHAPAWGATIRPASVKSFIHCFNPRPRMGGDMRKFGLDSSLTGFNPRPRMGGDQNMQLSILHITCFNPRPRMGGD